MWGGGLGGGGGTMLLRGTGDTTLYPRGEGGEKEGIGRLCRVWERGLRLEEWGLRAREQNEADPDYCEPSRIYRDMKRQSKGRTLEPNGQASTSSTGVLDRDIKMEHIEGRRPRKR